MEKITELLDKLENLGDLLPKLNTLTGWIQWLISLAVRIGPICMLVLGLIYLLIPPKEANHKAGYRTYFGMGSVQAWQYSQRLAGLVFGIAGGVLLIVGIIGCIIMGAQESLDAVSPALVILIIQVVGAVGAYGFVEVMIAKNYDANGNLKGKRVERVRAGTADTESVSE